MRHPPRQVSGGTPGHHPRATTATTVLTSAHHEADTAHRTEALDDRSTDDLRLEAYQTRTGWHGDIPEGHYAIRDPHEPERVTMWRVKAGRLDAWPKEARNGPLLFRRDVPADPADAKRVRETYYAAIRSYWAAVENALAANPEEAAARYAASTFRCAICNRKLRVPESNGYGVGPECRSWMPPSLLAEYARRMSLARAELDETRRSA